MERELRVVLIDAIKDVCRRKAETGAFSIHDAACEVAAGLSLDQPAAWVIIRDDLATDAVVRLTSRVITKAISTADSPQLVLPGLESLPPIIPAEGAALISRELTLEQYRAEERRLELKIKSYSYPRRKDTNLQRDKKQLRDMRRFDPRFARYSTNEPDLPLWKAKEIDLLRRRKPSVARSVKGGHTGGRGRRRPST